MPTVSVVIPSFNRRPWIAATVQSVLAQTYGDVEVIVVDDGSTDDTTDILTRDFGDRIRVVRLPVNHGRSAARNLGWTLARGEFVAFLDSDDLWLPSKLSRQMPFFDRPEVVLVHCVVGKTDQSGERLEEESIAMEREFERAIRRGYGYSGITRTWCRMYTSAVVVRRESLRQTGGFDPRLSNFEDWDVLWRLALAGEVATAPETLVLHRSHPGNTPTIWAQAAVPWLSVNRKHLSETAGAPKGSEARRARGNLFMNMALGEYWRRNLGASRGWMWRALMADPQILKATDSWVWRAPLLNALMPHPLADRLAARVGGDRYVTPERQAA
jgi:glycosyltransferase involved in cell wall biosynthesis